MDNEGELMKLAGGYHAVAPGAGGWDQLDKRKQVIDESKYLGGDMEHTHLVKGLDYALLQKVRSEIVYKEPAEDDEEQMESLYEKNAKAIVSDDAAAVADSDKPKSAVARNITAMIQQQLAPDARIVVNEMFAPRRMAYVVELEENDAWRADTDIPTTLIRSKAECPMDESTTSTSVNDVVIQKLSQVLSYLRADTKRKKAARDKMIAEAATVDPEQKKKDAAVR